MASASWEVPVLAQYRDHHATGRYRDNAAAFKPVAAKKIGPTLLITHHFTQVEGERAYETFGNAAKTKALKVVIST